MTESAAPTRAQCLKAKFPLSEAAESARIAYYVGVYDEGGCEFHSKEMLRRLNEAASALGLHVSAQPAAQQPSDLVRRLRIEAQAAHGDGYATSYEWQAADRIEALEAAAAQPSREAALVKALTEIAEGKYCPGEWMVDCASEALAATDTPAKDEANHER